MNERSVSSRQRVNDVTEYLKFAVLLVVALFAILMLAIASPYLIGRRAPVVLGLDRATAGQPLEAVEEAPFDMAGPETVIEPQGAAAPEGAAPVGAEVEGLRHEVQPGQTLFQVAELYGVSVQEIAAANHLVNPMQVQAGTVLIIPRSR